MIANRTYVHHRWDLARSLFLDQVLGRLRVPTNRWAVKFRRRAFAAKSRLPLQPRLPVQHHHERHVSAAVARPLQGKDKSFTIGRHSVVQKHVQRDP